MGTDSVSGNLRLRVGLINAMPATALSATERQFQALLPGVDVLPYRLPAVDVSSDVIPRHYRPFESLVHDGLDALVVTGLEPPTGLLEDAPFWSSLTHLFWHIRASKTPTLLSCLASHAWLHLFDGLPRRHLATKLSGVFPQDCAAPHPLVADLEGAAFPHSRHNDIPVEALAKVGCAVLLSGRTCGWTIGVDERDQARVVLIQGHPEYEADTLLREYRRDLGRWRAGELSGVPAPPVGYLTPGAEAVLVAHVGRLRAGADEAFPFDSLSADVSQPWSASSLALTRAWLSEVEVRARA